MAQPVAGNGAPFADRIAAGEQLARALGHHSARHPLVLAIPRGALPLAAVVAQRLHGDLDVVLVRKLGAPGRPELAVGSVDDTGWCWIAPWAAAAGATPHDLDREQGNQLQELRRRRALYTAHRPPIEAAGRTVIVVDDGLATGATMAAALHAVRERGPAWLMCAVPVASRSAVALVRPLADEVVCLSAPDDFTSVGQLYRDFPQVDDAEAASLLSPRAG